MMPTRPKYNSSYPCCGQSRFEPLKRTALDGKVWWCIFDHRMADWVRGERYKTRRAVVNALTLDFYHRRRPFEPDVGVDDD